MSLFDKMKKHQPPEKPNDGEFKSDVNTILHGTSVQNRKEMCELEYPCNRFRLSSCRIVDG